VSFRCTIEDKGEPVAVYQGLAPATRQLATTPSFTVSHCSAAALSWVDTPCLFVSALAGHAALIHQEREKRQ
jgi:hypothetical protein